MVMTGTVIGGNAAKMVQDIESVVEVILDIMRGRKEA